MLRVHHYFTLSPPHLRSGRSSLPPLLPPRPAESPPPRRHPPSRRYCYPWHLRDKVTPDERCTRPHAAASCHLRRYGRAGRLPTVLKAVCAPPYQLEPSRSGALHKDLVNIRKKQVYFKSGRSPGDLGIAVCLRWINGSYSGPKPMEPGLRSEGGFFFGCFFEGLFMIPRRLEQIMTSCERHFSAFSGTSLAHQKDLVMTRYRCQPRRF